MKILISTEEGGLIFYWKSVILALCKRGHRVHLVFAKHFADNVLSELQSINGEFPNFTFGHSFCRSNFWGSILNSKRAILAYRRVLTLRDQGKISDFYRNRLKRFFPWFLKPFVFFNSFSINSFIKSDAARRFLDYLERRAPIDPNIAGQLKMFAPDLVMVSLPCNLIGSTPDYDYLSAGKALGIPVLLSVISWDALEVKGSVNSLPDHMFLWNEIQQHSAVTKHGVPQEKTRIVGAPFYDNFFDEKLKPSKTREEFCKLYDLDPNRPILLYMGSSSIYGDETWVVRDFKRALDNAGDPLLRSAQILIRSHPAWLRPWKTLFGSKDFRIQGRGSVPGPEESRREYFDTIYHSSAMAGICTSGFIHAFIVGRPVISYLTPHYDQIQSYAPHWRQLKDSGVLEIVRTGEEFAETFAGILRGVDPGREKRANFIEKYVRPCGLDKKAGEAWADEIEKLFIAKNR